MPTHHLHYDSTLCRISLVLNRDFAFLHSGVFFSHVPQTAFEDGQKSLCGWVKAWSTSVSLTYFVDDLAGEASLFIMIGLEHLLLAICISLEKQVAVQIEGSICRPRSIQRSQ